MATNKIKALNFITELMATVDNLSINDSEFREFIRQTLNDVEKHSIHYIGNDHIKQRILKFYNEDEK